MLPRFAGEQKSIENQRCKQNAFLLIGIKTDFFDVGTSNLKKSDIVLSNLKKK